MTFDFRDYQTRLAQLVQQASVSCAVEKWDMSNRGVIDLLANWLSDIGFKTIIQPLEQAGKFNLVAVLGEGDGGLVLAGHTDTVPYDEHRWQSDPFTLTEKNEKLYGLGATDMKGFFPLVLQAAAAYRNQKLKHPLILLATADEESSMSGARALANEGIPGLKPRYAVIGEPTELKPIRMHKGIMMEAIRVSGKSGHSSNPVLGNNALDAMNDVITELKKIRGELQVRYQNPGFAVQTPTLNLGCIHGGDGANRICGECELHFDLRLLPGMNNQEIRSLIETRLNPIAAATKTDIVFSSLFESIEPFAEDKNSELIKTCEQLCARESESVAFATEAPFMQQLGMQTVIMGPGSIDQAHQPNEFIAKSQLQPAYTILCKLIETYCL
jgi:acetylornithine deacetylase